MGTSTQATLTATNMQSFEQNTQILLKDELLNQTIDLRQQPVYSFNYTQGNNEHRFNLLVGGTIGIENPVTANEKLWFDHQSLNIALPMMAGQKARVELYSATGAMLLSKEITLDAVNTIPVKFEGTLVARVITNGKLFTVKGLIQPSIRL